MEYIQSCVTKVERGDTGKGKRKDDYCFGRGVKEAIKFVVWQAGAGNR
jgi:hypothetical protein